MSIEALYAELEQARITWQSLHDLLVQGQYDINAARPSLNGQSVARLYRRTVLVFEGLFGIRPSDEDSVPGVFVAGKSTEIRASIKIFNDYAQASLTTLRTNWREDMMLRDQNGNFLLQLTLPDNSVVTNTDLSGNFQQMEVAVGQLLGQLAQLLPLCRADAVGDLSARAVALGELVRESDGLRNQGRQLAEAASLSANAAAERERAVQNALTQAEAALSKLQALQQQGTTDIGNVTALVEKIKTVGASADVLEQRVAGYTASFEAFQMQLDGRNQEFAQFQTDTKVAEEANSKRSAEIDRLTQLV